MRVALSVLLLASALSAAPRPGVHRQLRRGARAGVRHRLAPGRCGRCLRRSRRQRKAGAAVLGRGLVPAVQPAQGRPVQGPGVHRVDRQVRAVYLDGDEEGAQAWGERFGVRGYPTLIVLDPQRNELTRVAGGNDAAELTRALTVAAGRRSAIARHPGDGTGHAGQAGRRRLAGAGRLRLGSRRQPPGRRAQEPGCAAPAVQGRTDAALQRRFALLALATADTPASSPTEVRELLQAVLAQPAEVRRNRELLGYAGATLVKQASAGPGHQNTLGQQLLVALERADAERGNRADDALSRALTEVSLARQQQPNGALPAALVERVKQRVVAADAAATDAHARQATISSAVYALRQVGDDAGAEALLLPS